MVTAAAHHCIRELLLAHGAPLPPTPAASAQDATPFMLRSAAADTVDAFAAQQHCHEFASCDEGLRFCEQQVRRTGRDRCCCTSLSPLATGRLWCRSSALFSPLLSRLAKPATDDPRLLSLHIRSCWRWRCAAGCAGHPARQSPWSSCCAPTWGAWGCGGTWGSKLCLCSNAGRMAESREQGRQHSHLHSASMFLHPPGGLLAPHP